MSKKTWPSLDLNSLSRAYQRGELTPSDLVREIHQRIAARGDDAVWIHVISEADVQRQAEALGPYSPEKPLYGVPFAVKDNMDVAGLPTTAACPEFSYIPHVTATVIQRLLAAGAILIGKTNLDQFATGLVGVRSPHGAPSCVFNDEYISGGSSSGSAVAVAAGLVSFALGTDTAGSGRVPAAFNNIVGWKPTRGLLSTLGIVPACRSLDCPSVFTLTAPDAKRIARIAAAPDEADPYSRPAPPICPTLPQKFRFGIPPAHQLEFFGDTEAEGLFLQSAADLAALGGEAVQIDFAPFREAADLLYSGPWVAERLAAVTPFIDQKPEAFHPITRKIIEGGRRFSAADTFRAFYQLEALRRRASIEWATMDLLLIPTTGTIYTHEQLAANPIGHNTDLGFYTNFVNLLDLTGIAVPAGFRTNGLPFGVTLLGPAFLDEALCDLAAHYHARRGGRVGATDTCIQDIPEEEAFRSGPVAPDGLIPVAVVGAHLRGQPLNGQLLELGAIFERVAKTAPGYRLFALAGTVPPKPGLLRDSAASGPGINVEIWRLSPVAFGRLTASIQAPLGMGTLELEDGGQVHGFLCESFATVGAREITKFGGWRSFLAANKELQNQEKASHCG